MAFPHVQAVGDCYLNEATTLSIYKDRFIQIFKADEIASIRFAIGNGVLVELLRFFSESCTKDPRRSLALSIPVRNGDLQEGFAHDGAFFLHNDTGLSFVYADSCFYCRTIDVEALAAVLIANIKVSHKLNEDALSKVFWNQKTTVLRDDILFFSQAHDWFNLRGLPYKRGYLLYGPPGNGKTSAIRAISEYFGLQALNFDFTAPGAHDGQFLDWVGQRSEPHYEKEIRTTQVSRVLVLEDVDRFFPKGQAPKTNVSLSALLNGLDGVVQVPGTIIIATANHPEDLERSVVSRPGRFDIRLEFDPPNETEAFGYLTRLFQHDPVTETALKSAVKKLSGHSYALHESILSLAGTKMHVRKVDKVVNDTDLSAAVAIALEGADTMNVPQKAGFE